jgi:hypothetical protein
LQERGHSQLKEVEAHKDDKRHHGQRDRAGQQRHVELEERQAQARAGKESKQRKRHRIERVERVEELLVLPPSIRDKSDGAEEERQRLQRKDGLGIRKRKDFLHRIGHIAEIAGPVVRQRPEEFRERQQQGRAEQEGEETSNRRLAAVAQRDGARVREGSFLVGVRGGAGCGRRLRRLRRSRLLAAARPVFPTLAASPGLGNQRLPPYRPA